MKSLKAVWGKLNSKKKSEMIKIDEDSLPASPLPNNLNLPPPDRKHRKSVSAEVYGEFNKMDMTFKPPVYPKTDEQRQRIMSAMANSFIFGNLEEEDRNKIIDAFLEKRIPKNVTIIRQGDDGDCLYLIEQGSFDVFKNNTIYLTTMTVGEAVGELSLLYNTPRAASVISKEDSIIWCLDRQSFNMIVRGATIARRNMYDELLQEVELLQELDPYERSKLSDALKLVKFQANDIIIKEGDIDCDILYIIVEGEAEATKAGLKVLDYKRGGYFGELALFKNQPRAATVTAITDCVCVSLDKKSFDRLLGPLDSILQRNVDKYKKVTEGLRSSS